MVVNNLCSSFYRDYGVDINNESTALNCFLKATMAIKLLYSGVSDQLHNVKLQDMQQFTFNHLHSPLNHTVNIKLPLRNLIYRLTTVPEEGISAIISEYNKMHGGKHIWFINQLSDYMISKSLGQITQR